MNNTLSASIERMANTNENHSGRQKGKGMPLLRDHIFTHVLLLC